MPVLLVYSPKTGARGLLMAIFVLQDLLAKTAFSIRCLMEIELSKLYFLGTKKLRPWKSTLGPSPMNNDNLEEKPKQTCFCPFPHGWPNSSFHSERCPSVWPTLRTGQAIFQNNLNYTSYPLSKASSVWTRKRRGAWCISGCYYLPGPLGTPDQYNSRWGKSVFLFLGIPEKWSIEYSLFMTRETSLLSPTSSSLGVGRSWASFPPVLTRHIHSLYFIHSSAHLSGTYCQATSNIKVWRMHTFLSQEHHQLLHIS